MTEAKYTAFGPDPLAAYYSAVETETKKCQSYIICEAQRLFRRYNKSESEGSLCIR